MLHSPWAMAANPATKRGGVSPGRRQLPPRGRARGSGRGPARALRRHRADSLCAVARARRHSLRWAAARAPIGVVGTQSRLARRTRTMGFASNVGSSPRSNCMRRAQISPRGSRAINVTSSRRTYRGTRTRATGAATAVQRRRARAFTSLEAGASPGSLVRRRRRRTVERSTAAAAARRSAASAGRAARPRGARSAASAGRAAHRRWAVERDHASTASVAAGATARRAAAAGDSATAAARAAAGSSAGAAAAITIRVAAARGQRETDADHESGGDAHATARGATEWTAALGGLHVPTARFADEERLHGSEVFHARAVSEMMDVNATAERGSVRVRRWRRVGGDRQRARVSVH